MGAARENHIILTEAKRLRSMNGSWLHGWYVKWDIVHRRFQPDHHCFELLPGAAFSFPKNDALQGLT